MDGVSMRAGILAAAIAASVTGLVPAGAQDVSVGEKLYKKTCKNCHGPTAKGLASFPKLTGNTVEYLVMRLEQYRGGEKIGPNTPLMAPQAKKLSDEDIINLSTYITTTFQ